MLLAVPPPTLSHGKGFAAGHVRLNRMDKRSQLNCLKECGRLLGLGCSVLFFPEGTRTTDGKMAAFKKASDFAYSNGCMSVL